MTRRNTSKWRSAILCLGVLAFLVSLGNATWSGARAQSSPPPAATVARLEYREVDFAPVATEISILPGAHFKKEPVFNGNNVFRGFFCLGTNTNLFVPFAWDNEQRKLYVDANRNLDLTDDAPGGYLAADRSLELFRGVRLQFPSAQGDYQVLVDAHVFGPVVGPAGKPRVFLYVRSLWEGGVELNGKKWYLAVIDGLNGRIGPATSLRQVSDRMILRPWEQRNEPFLWWHATLEKIHSLAHVKMVTFPYRWAGNAEVYDAFNLPENLFVQDRAYHLDYHAEAGNGPANLTVAFNPAQPALGRLRVSGQYLRRVVLDGGTSPGGFAAILDSVPPDRASAETGTDVQVPVGLYPRQIVLLQRAGRTNLAVGLATNQIVITETNTNAFAAGGPLNNSVRIQPASGEVTLDYELTNASGILFHLVRQDETAPPRFEMRQGDKLVAQGTFEFGSGGNCSYSWRVPPQLTGEVSIVTRAEIGGLGASEGALRTWTVPGSRTGIPRDASPGVQPSRTVAQPLNSAPAARSGNDATSWGIFALVMCLAIFLVRRLNSNGQR